MILKGNITISSPHMIFMKLPMLQDKCIFGLKVARDSFVLVPEDFKDILA